MVNSRSAATWRISRTVNKLPLICSVRVGEPKIVAMVGGSVGRSSPRVYVLKCSVQYLTSRSSSSIYFSSSRQQTEIEKGGAAKE